MYFMGKNSKIGTHGTETEKKKRDSFLHMYFITAIVQQW